MHTVVPVSLRERPNSASAPGGKRNPAKIPPFGSEPRATSPRPGPLPEGEGILNQQFAKAQHNHVRNDLGNHVFRRRRAALFHRPRRGPDRVRAGCWSVTSGRCTPGPCSVAWATTRRRRKCARRCISASCGRSADCAAPQLWRLAPRDVAARMAINRAVRRNSLAGGGESLDSVAAAQPTPLGSMLARERRSQVRRGLRRLGDLDRKTLLAFYFEGARCWR